MAGKRNPWADRWESIGSQYGGDRFERAAMRMEAKHAQEMPVDECGICGADAFFRPGVGAYQCPQCGAVRARGEWRK